MMLGNMGAKYGLTELLDSTSTMALATGGMLIDRLIFVTEILRCSASDCFTVHRANLTQPSSKALH